MLFVNFYCLFVNESYLIADGLQQTNKQKKKQHYLAYLCYHLYLFLRPVERWICNFLRMQ